MLPGRREEELFIANLSLPTYFSVSKYNYTDVLDALAMRLMVYDFVKRDKILKKEAKEEIDTQATDIDEKPEEPKKDDDNLDVFEHDLVEERLELVHEMNMLQQCARLKEIMILKELALVIKDYKDKKGIDYP